MSMLWSDPDRHEAEREADGFLRGVAVATVTDNRDPDGQSRIRVRFPWQPDEQSSFWARLTMPMTGDDMGTYFLPEIGDEVLVAFERGEQEHAFIIGALWNGAAPAPENNGDGENKTRLIRTRDKHELRFTDDPAAPEIDLKLADGKHLKLDRDGVVVEDASGNMLTIESNSGAITIKSTGTLSLQSTQISIEADASLSLSASGEVSIQGAMVRIN
ncbi:phage baseplate assembly protein V [Ruegeria sp. MALMAid1280]|uniref:phage baseplate assembly protein V n=1 Tax=Ruegeria sp. MALMAid1280 TaxID=3411634 RepID=UPI003BA1830F